MIVILFQPRSWWRHQIETFSALLAICAGNSPVTGEFPAQRPVTRSFDVFFDLRLNARLSKQSWGWWFVTLSWPLWRHCNDISILTSSQTVPLVPRKWRHRQNVAYFHLPCLSQWPYSRMPQSRSVLSLLTLPHPRYRAGCLLLLGRHSSPCQDSWVLFLR